jgi:hypothetical protein
MLGGFFIVDNYVTLWDEVLYNRGQVGNSGMFYDSTP